MRMKVVIRAVDQAILIGQDIVVAPTDIDEKTVRVIARGRMFGGPTDGGTFQSAHEMSKGQMFRIGESVAVTLIDIVANKARLGVNAPPHMDVIRKEKAQQQNLRGNDAS
jgi:sRNA-binding carbon storage regulator CsrA